MNLALLPLDERPANTRYPAQIAAIAGANLLLPPPNVLPARRQAAAREALAAWLLSEATQAHGVVASIDLLGYGGLITSRISDDDLATVLRAVEPLMAVRAPNRPVFAFNVIQRISNANEATEEPDYWAAYGTRLYRLSREMDAQGALLASDALEASDAYYWAVHDWLTRRARNHAVNLAMLREAALDKFDLLVISSDDTSPIGLSARERKHLEFWRDALFPGVSQRERMLMYPGADDVGTALVARMINSLRHHVPRVFVYYTDEAMINNVAPYEDRPIHQAVATQIMAVGAAQTTRLDEADVVLVVSPPFERIGERDPHWHDHDLIKRCEALLPAVQQIGRWLDENRRVAVADVAFPNGADPALVSLLFDHTGINKLAAFGAWNTAGNTLGTVLGAACVPCEDDHARQTALAHHLLEDWGYQSIVRDDLRSWLSETFGEPRIPAAHVAEATAFTSAWLEPLAERIRAAGLPCTPRNVRLPWQRTFEVDFDLAA